MNEKIYYNAKDIAAMLGISMGKAYKILREISAFTVMVRLSDKQYNTIYNQLQKYTQEYIDNKYLCGDGGWIHYRVTGKEHFNDIKKLLSVKCT